jgi:hypothetical protein
MLLLIFVYSRIGDYRSGSTYEKGAALRVGAAGFEGDKVNVGGCAQAAMLDRCTAMMLTLAAYRVDWLTGNLGHHQPLQDLDVIHCC